MSFFRCSIIRADFELASFYGSLHENGAADVSPTSKWAAVQWEGPDSFQWWPLRRQWPLLRRRRSGPSWYRRRYCRWRRCWYRRCTTALRPCQGCATRRMCPCRGAVTRRAQTGRRASSMSSSLPGVIIISAYSFGNGFINGKLMRGLRLSPKVDLPCSECLVKKQYY